MLHPPLVLRPELRAVDPAGAGLGVAAGLVVPVGVGTGAGVGAGAGGVGVTTGVGVVPAITKSTLAIAPSLDPWLMPRALRVEVLASRKGPV